MSILFSYRITKRTVASPTVLFGLVSDGGNWSTWARPIISHSRWESLGPDGDGGLGAIRAVGTPRHLTREVTTIHEPGRRHGYTMLSKSPVEDYRAEVTMIEADGRTVLTWQGSYHASSRVVGVLYLLVVKVSMSLIAGRLVRAAESSQPESA